MRYFTHDPHCRSNRKIRKLLREQGAIGYACWWALLEELHQAEDSGYQLEYDELLEESLAESLRIPAETLRAVLDTCARSHLIDPDAWADGFLTVAAITERGDEYVQKKAANAARMRDVRARAKTCNAQDERATHENSVQDVSLSMQCSSMQCNAVQTTATPKPPPDEPVALAAADGGGLEVASQQNTEQLEPSRWAHSEADFVAAESIAGSKSRWSNRLKRAFSGCSPGEVQGAIDLVRQKISEGKANNPAGLLVTALEQKLCPDPPPPRASPQLAPDGWRPPNTNPPGRDPPEERARRAAEVKAMREELLGNAK